ncbi:SDR family NAD(P)-dependent oxidoreductase [Variovorax sp. PBL-E5]|uniref:SDR family NAD(P)-dependent oxidoreductase n=1 Tax=Variovorax sp. PBL-E5 TaxID=434014 RepID=UPI0013176CD0|nr:SDR family NAD(P)-dependent oxidoreductase [Variovorax sp. PBL-E5]VTU30305.1 4-formylbenzenesulfonate dehydrogenase TsaC1/TsaC2 [Variovorax sp. PBL-E5]
MSRFNKKIVAITGGGGGMGVELCGLFQSEGASVVVMDASEAAVQAGVRAVEGQALGVVVDVASEASVEEAFARVVEQYGRIDVLVCAAGVRPMAQLLDQATAEWERCLQINLTGVFLCNRIAARHMVAQGGGSIINIASINGVRACTGMGAYNVSKAGVIALTQTLACEVAPQKVRVNAILPAQVETPMIKEQVGEERRRREERIPMGRYGKPHEIASAVAFLASDDSSFMTGHAMAVDGGYLAFGFRPVVYA